MIFLARGKTGSAHFSCGVSYLAAIVLAYLVVLLPQAHGQGAGKAPTGDRRPPGADAKVMALQSLGENLSPLFVLGDLNEDGVVNEKDLELMRQVINRWNSEAPSEVSCLAAADVTENGIVNERDFELVSGWVRAGPVTAPALWYQSFLPCDFKQFFVAAQTSATVGGVVNIRFLDTALNSTNSRVTIASGNAQVTAADGNRGYDVTVSPAAQVDDLIKVRLELSKRGAFLFTIPVR